MSRIPIADLQAQHASIRSELDEAVRRVFDSADFILGREVAAFEEEFAAYCGGGYAVGVNSGTSALHLALLAAGIGPGDEVITVPFSFVATVATIQYTGARARLVDIDPCTWTLDPARLEAALTPRTKAILPVHLFGLCADMDPIRAFARRHNLIVIEDAAQAHGASYHGIRAGMIGDLACFSFYPGKNLGACGEGGMVVTANQEYARTLRMLRNWGAEERYVHRLKGYNYRMDGLQGAVLRVKLRHLEAWTETRRAHAALYGELLKGAAVDLPVEASGCRHVFHVYGIRARDRNALQQSLAAEGIETRINYPVPIHLQPAYEDLGYQRGDFPVSERLAEQQLSLPVSAELRRSQIETVASALRRLT